MKEQLIKMGVAPETIEKLYAAKTLSEFIAVKSKELTQLQRAFVESEGLVVQVLGKDTYESNQRIYEERKARRESEEAEEFIEEIFS